MLVVGLHLALFWALRQHHGLQSVRRTPAPPASAPLWLRWIDERTALDEHHKPLSQPVESSRARVTRPMADTRPRPAAQRDRSTDDAPVTPTPSAQSLSGATSTAQATQPSPATSPSRENLDLTLPRGAAAPWRRPNPALERADRERPTRTIEAFVAQAMSSGHGPWTEERIDTDTIRLRRGDVCVLVTRTRVENLDPFNRSHSPTPWLVSPPSDCR